MRAGRKIKELWQNSRDTGSSFSLVPCLISSAEDEQRPKRLKTFRVLKNPRVGEDAHDHNKHGEICLGLVLDWGYAHRRAANQLWAALDRL